jgi:hypothetical protein
MGISKRSEVDKEEEWDEWLLKIPKIKFKEDWEVRIIPPFGGAMARFWIDKGDKHVSVYLDCYQRLGYFGGHNGEPYWELYPYHGDTYRCAMRNTEELTAKISEILD